MNRLLIILALLAGMPATVSGQPYASLFESETAVSMRVSAEALSAMDEAGSAAYMRNSFRAAGLDVLDSPDDSSFGIASESGDTLVCHNAVAWIQGYDKALRNRYIVIGAPIAGNATALALLLELSRRLGTNSVLLKRSVVVAAFGDAGSLNAGSWYFLNRSFAGDAANIDAMVDLFQLGEGGRGFHAYTASNADLNRIIDALAVTLQPVKPVISSREPAISDHRSFYAREIPSVMFTSGDIPKLTVKAETPEYDWMERELEYIYNFVMELSGCEAPAFSPVKIQQQNKSPEAVSWSDCDIKPAFMNNYDPGVFLGKWVYTYLKYPRYAVENGIQGKVLVDFIIDTRGKVRNVRVLKGVHPSLDAEAVKVIEASPDWRPARVRGKKVNCEMSLYVEFRLKKK